ncbi:MAG: putative alpha/beta superfamily hydrolase [Flavobacteriaceae bacterium]|jgi:predicted alpha/beta superfamily hydrolase|uniref:alpha/beta hydrolase-fold protein n=1 Tax=Candidatus Marifrigoribacter sp. Uisw_064 TaxID=3230970 RepID=UPI003AEB4F3F
MKNYFFLVLFVTLFSTQQNAQSQEANARIADSIYSDHLKEQRNFWIKLPENYNPSIAEKYPVVYILDGFSLENTLNVVYENYYGHYLPPMILVGISNSTHRTRDLTPTQIKMRRGSAMDEETGGADNLTQFIEKELIPYIDSKYASSPYRTLIGHSYAGLFAVNIMLNHTPLFKNYIAIDPSIEWDNQYILNQAKEKFKTESFEGVSLYMSLAAEQLHMLDEKVTLSNVMEDTSEFTLFPRSILEFSQVAESNKKNGLHFSMDVYPEDLHGTVPLPSIRDGLVFLFEWFQFKHPQLYNNPETTVAEIEALLNKQEEIYTSHLGYKTPPMVEELFNGYGYMNLQMGQPEKAYLFFKMNIDYYPNSANGYDSMAEYYESQNNFSEALKYVTKAYELNNSDYYKERVEKLKEKN